MGRSVLAAQTYNLTENSGSMKDDILNIVISYLKLRLGSRDSVVFSDSV